MISYPESQAIAARWQFCRNGSVRDDLVPKPILRSWTRCAGIGLAMDARPRVEPMTAGELQELRDRNEALRRISRPEVEALLLDAQATDSIVILTDASGMVLDTLGSADFAERASRVALKPGVPWSEATTGTNAIGTALVERRPVAVHGLEHYFEPNRILSCAASPILDPQGEIVGVLDLSGPSTMAHLHAPGLVQLAVDQIEHRFFEHAFVHCEVLRFHSDPALLGTPREGIFVFEDHRLVAANRHALALLGLGPEAFNGRRFGDLFAQGLGRLEERCRLRTHRGDDLHGRLRRPIERAVPRKNQPCGGGARIIQEPWFDEMALLSRAHAVQLVDADIPVLLQGETGCGKEVFARQVHAHGARSAKPFVAINCVALPETLIESELFGYEEGAFTGARRRGSTGLFRQAEGGVLFLDEIGDMPLGLQTRLLRVLQEREVTPLGGGRPIPVDFAVICATHQNLRDLVATGAFRSDLYFRIGQYTIDLPSVRALPDKRAVIRTLWAQLSTAEARIVLAPETIDLLAAYEWPGNFRQLVGTLRALLVLAEPDRALAPDRLPAEIRRGSVPVATPAAPQQARTENCRLDHMTKEMMRVALALSGGNVSEAARRLGINRSTLYRRLLSESGRR